MNYVLDTGILIEISKGNRNVISALSKEFSGRISGQCITLFNFAEYFRGEVAIGKEEQALTFLNSFAHLPLTAASAKLYAKLGYKYAKKGVPLADIDLFIAAISIENSALLITTDTDFERIEELRKIVVR